MNVRPHYDVVILGAGLAGSSLTRQLLLDTDKTVLLLDRKRELPPPGQKVGEATVQVSGYYFSKVLDLEEYLLRRHYLKYNLRFFWKSASRDNTGVEDYSQAYIRKLSNIASYQLDRNEFERELLERNRASERCDLLAPVRGIEAELAQEGDAPHRITFEHDDHACSVTADWVVDCTGKGRLFARREALDKPTPIAHGSTWLWVDGLVDVERLTRRSRREVRVNRDRSFVGHLPAFLATNHFMGEGFWFWVIPLHGQTSLGLVYDKNVLSHDEVGSPEKMLDWVCREFPLFAADLPQREVLHWGAFRDFATDASATIHPQRWALSGMAGRFSDPLYSPGGDLIALHNTLITDAIATDDPGRQQSKIRGYEQLMKAFYGAYVPSYADSYDVLGDQECYVLKYTWELTVYFAFYVFPFINDLFTDRRFTLSFMRAFAELGPINKSLMHFLSAYFQWKKEHAEAPDGPHFADFTHLQPLADAERTFYRVGVTVEEARTVLTEQLDNLRELGRFIVAHVASVVLGDEEVKHRRAFVESIDPATCVFDPELFRERWAASAEDAERYAWRLDPDTHRALMPELRQEEALVGAAR